MTILDKPPAGWKRPSISLSVKVEVLERTLKQLWAVETIEYDHRPALSARRFSTEGKDTMPPANHPGYIEPVPVALHRERTFGTKATSYGSDAHERAKERRLVAVYHNTPIYEVPKIKQSRPLPGGRASKWKKKVSGQVVERKPNEHSRGPTTGPIGGARRRK